MKRNLFYKIDFVREFELGSCVVNVINLFFFLAMALLPMFSG